MNYTKVIKIVNSRGPLINISNYKLYIAIGVGIIGGLVVCVWGGGGVFP